MKNIHTELSTELDEKGLNKKKIDEITDKISKLNERYIKIKVRIHFDYVITYITNLFSPLDIIKYYPDKEKYIIDKYSEILELISKLNEYIDILESRESIKFMFFLRSEYSKKENGNHTGELDPIKVLKKYYEINGSGTKERVSALL